MTLYNRLTNGLSDRGVLVPASDLQRHITDYASDWYSSVYYYTQNEYNQFQKTGSVAGITGLKSNKLIFDFDADDISVAQSHALDVATKLLQAGITEDQFNICFSGNKGFSIEMTLAQTYSEAELKAIAKNLAGDKSTWDTKVYNSSRIFRLPYTRHNKSGLYKLPITLAQLSELSVDQIKDLAVTSDNGQDWKLEIVQLPESLKVKVELKVNLNTFVELPEFERNAKWMPACRELILNGFFPNGHRNHALMALAATFKANGFPKEVAHRSLKGAAELQAKRHNVEAFSSDEIWNNIIKTVYSPQWKGATYACKDHEWLAEICALSGKHACALKAAKNEFTTIGNLASRFMDFAKNIDKNRIYTGIEELDKKIMLTTSMPVGLLGAPGSGKTSLALDILNHTSNAGVKSMFCSFDMGWSLIYSKLISRVSGLKVEDVLDTYKFGLEDFKDYDNMVADQFKNVIVSFDSSKTLDEIKEAIQAENERSEEKVKLVVIDYLECLAGPYSDSNANGAYLANKIKNLATDLELCVIVLVQPPKSAGDASQPLTSMRQIKGASTLEQNFRAILGVHREGFSPDSPEKDKFMTVTCLKNTLGGLFRVDLGWNGLQGHIRSLNSDEKDELGVLREELKEAKSNSSSSGWGD